MRKTDLFPMYTGGIAETNAYCIPHSHGHILIDAPEGVADWLAAKGLKPSHLLLTHQHFDHVMDAAKLQRQGIKICAFAPYSAELTLEHITRSWGMPDVGTFMVDELLENTTAFAVEGLTFAIAHVPGHSPDSITFYHNEQSALFAGDTLFHQSIGRTDLPGHGNNKLLLDGIRSKLLSLPPQTRVYPGHGGSTTIGGEMANNPYL